MATIRDIARRAGVSVSTASLAMNDDTRVRPETRQRVLEAVREFSYRPSRSARSLSNGLTYTIHLINALGTTELTSGFLTRFLEGLHEGAAASSYTVALSIVSGDREAAAHTETLISERWTDGLILLNPSDNSALLDLLVARAFPHVVLGRDPHDRGFSVDNDNHRVGADAARHLAERVAGPIAFVSGTRSQTFARDRAQGFLAEALEMGVEAEVVYTDGRPDTAGPHTVESVRRGARGVAFASDSQAAFALRALLADGIRVPADVALLGMNNDALGEILDPALSTIDLNAFELGRQAAGLLLESLSRPDLEAQRRLVPHSLVQREST